MLCVCASVHPCVFMCVWHLGWSSWVRALNIPHLPVHTFCMTLDLKLRLSHFSTVTKSICVLYLWGRSCHEQFIFGQTCSLSCGIHISCFHFQVRMAGTNRADDLMLLQCIKNAWNISFEKPCCIAWFEIIRLLEVQFHTEYIWWFWNSNKCVCSEAVWY